MFKKQSRTKRVLVQVLVVFFCFNSHALSAEMIPGAVGLEKPTNITLDFKEADINTVLRVLSIKSGVNIVAGPEVQGTVTIRLQDVPWDKALEVVLRTYDYVYERSDNIIRVTTREKMAQEPVVTQTYVLNYTRASEVQASVTDMLTERGRIQIAERTNTLVITDIPTNLFRIGQVILNLDRITPQAYIDSKVVNTRLGEAENLGIQWQTGGAANNLGSITGSNRPTTFPFSGDSSNRGIEGALNEFFPFNANGDIATNPNDSRGFPTNDTDGTTAAPFTFGTLNFSAFGAILQALKSRSDTKVVSNPRIVVLNNQTASVQVGSDIPLPSFERNETTGSVEVTGFTFREVGVVLNVTPHINSEEEILVELHPEISSLGANVNFGQFQIPSFSVTRAVTQVLIRSGETIAIGGLLTDNITTNEAKVPLLSDIPFVGKIFRSKRQTPGTGNEKAETLFFVTVTMVDTEGQPAGEDPKVRRKRERQESQEDAQEAKERIAARTELVNAEPASTTEEPVNDVITADEEQVEAPVSETGNKEVVA